MAFRKRAEPTTIDEERAALQAQHAALEDLKREMAERVDAVRQRELELHHLLAEAGSARPGHTGAAASLPRGPALGDDNADTGENARVASQRGQQLVDRENQLAARAHELDARERELEQRIVRENAALDERKLELEAGREAAPEAPVEAGTARLAEIEGRLEELRDAERLFLRTREELAARSEAVAARERLAAQKERELDERDDAAEPWVGTGLSEMEARLRRLEQQQPAGEQTLGFSSGLKKLQQGTKRPQ